MTAELKNLTTEKVKDLRQQPNSNVSKTEKMLVEQKKIKIETKSLNQANEKEKLKLLGEDRARELVEEFKNDYKKTNWKAFILTNKTLSTYKNTYIDLFTLAEQCRENPKQHGGLLLEIAGEKIAIPPKSALLQLLQCFLLDQGDTIADGNKKNSLQSIDGVFANDSLDALMSWKKNMDLQREIVSKTSNDQLQAKWERDIFADFQRKLEEDTKEIPELQKERNLEVIDLLGGGVAIFSYGESTYIDIEEWELSVSSKKNRLEFPFRLTLDKDSKTDTYSRNESNAERLRRLYGLANIINRAQSLSDKISNKGADNYQPFHIDGKGLNLLSSRIQVEDGISDLNLIKIDNLKPYAKVFKMEVDDFAKVLVDFLYKIHDANYRPTPTSEATGNGGGRTI